MAELWMAEFDKQWNMEYEKLVEFIQKNGHCIVPRLNDKDKAFGLWVNTQRMNHTHKKIRLD